MVDLLRLYPYALILFYLCIFFILEVSEQMLTDYGVLRNNDSRSEDRVEERGDGRRNQEPLFTCQS